MSEMLDMANSTPVAKFIYRSSYPIRPLVVNSLPGNRRDDESTPDSWLQRLRTHFGGVLVTNMELLRAYISLPIVQHIAMADFTEMFRIPRQGVVIHDDKTHAPCAVFLGSPEGPILLEGPGIQSMEGEVSLYKIPALW